MIALYVFGGMVGFLLGHAAHRLMLRLVWRHMLGRLDAELREHVREETRVEVLSRQNLKLKREVADLKSELRKSSRPEIVVCPTCNGRCTNEPLVARTMGDERLIQVGGPPCSTCEGKGKVDWRAAFDAFMR